MLFEDLRIDEDDFKKLDFEEMARICDKYACNSLKHLAKYISNQLPSDLPFKSDSRTKR